MAHLHSVYDTDSHFSINIITRSLKNEASQKVTVMQFDHNSERFTFEIPRYIEEHDMSTCNRVEVHYQNGTAKGVYEVDDLQVSPESEDVVICSWLISQNATQNAAALDFRLTFKCVSDDGTVDYSWSTAMYKGITVQGGANNSEAVAEQYADVLESWRKYLESGGEGPVKLVESPDENGNMKYLRDLESGTYILSGQFIGYHTDGDPVTVLFSGNYPVVIERTGEKTYLQRFNPVCNSVQYAEITDYTISEHEPMLLYMPQSSGVAEVGQVLIVSEVDENNRPVKWEYYKPMVANITVDSETNEITIDHAYDEIKAAILASKDIKFVLALPAVFGGGYAYYYVSEYGTYNKGDFATDGILIIPMNTSYPRLMIWADNTVSNESLN